MLYIALETNHIRVLYLKKSLLGQYESSFYEKKYEANFLENGIITNPDLVASAIKESLTHISSTPIKEKDVHLILPQGAFHFTRTEVPTDVAQSALPAFIKDKARANLMVDTDTCSYDYIIQEFEGVQEAVIYAMENEVAQKCVEPLKLIDLELRAITPESLSYFTLFEKTLRKDKKENIFFVSYHKEYLVGYVYDSFGLLEKDKWIRPLKGDEAIEDILKDKVQEYEQKGIKLNRLILSGEKSDEVRQDTFTKHVGVWTNPLKRIIPHFYDEHMKLFSSESDKIMPFLHFDVCTGTCVFELEHKDFSLYEKGKFASKGARKPKTYVRGNEGKGFPVKLAIIGVVSFLATLGIIFAISRVNFGEMNVNLAFLQEPTATPTLTPTVPPPTPTPTIAIVKEDLDIKVLNGSGESGVAGELRETLIDAGYGEVLPPENADNFDYETTEIQVKEESEGAGELIAEDIADNVPSPDITTLDDEDEAADVIVIIGADYE